MTGVTALFIDSNIALYAVGGPHRHKAACRGILEAATTGTVTLHASVELIQEVLHHRLRIDHRETAIAAARWLTDLCTVHPFTKDVARSMLNLVATTSIRDRDAVHAATALAAGFDQIVTVDPNLAVPGLTIYPSRDSLATHLTRRRPRRRSPPPTGPPMTDRLHHRRRH